ncbi:hypothetical protein DPV78_011626, partial [Talaromyces pinophilus]
TATAVAVLVVVATVKSASSVAIVSPCEKCKSRNLPCLPSNIDFTNAPKSFLWRKSLGNTVNVTSSGQQRIESTATLDNCLPSCTSPVPSLSRLLQDTPGTFSFVGDSSHISFLQHTRRLVRLSIGNCAFVDDPLQYQICEDSVNQPPHWLHAATSPEKPNLVDAIELVYQFFWATSCNLDLFDEDTLVREVTDWIESGKPNNPYSSASLFPVLAIGLQASRERNDETAQSYFNHGRYLTMYHFRDGLSVRSTQLDVLTAWYLLFTSQRNAAYMHLGTAIRAGYALGLHRNDISMPFNTDDRVNRQRLWKSIRVLDGFLSLALGRPSSIAVHTNDDQLNGHYSATLELCNIFENILNQVYGQQMISVTGHASDTLRRNGILQPNIGFYHLKEAFYWSVSILTLPFLLDFVSKKLSEDPTQSHCVLHSEIEHSLYNLLVHTCVDTTFNTLEMLQKLLTFTGLPKRMPFVVNSVFLAALTISLAIFGNLNYSSPLERHLHTAKSLLSHFAVYDPAAQRQLAVVEDLNSACETHIDRRCRRGMESRAEQLRTFFGGHVVIEPVAEPDITTIQHCGIGESRDYCSSETLGATDREGYSAGTGISSQNLYGPIQAMEGQRNCQESQRQEDLVPLDINNPQRGANDVPLSAPTPLFFRDLEDAFSFFTFSTTGDMSDGILNMPSM